MIIDGTLMKVSMSFYGFQGRHDLARRVWKITLGIAWEKQLDVGRYRGNGQ
jgi:hypothetical protein